MSWIAWAECFFGLHKFGRWHLEYSSTDHEWYQWRICDHCGHLQTRSCE